MSRSVPFEDPLLHPPTPPINTEPPAAEVHRSDPAQQQSSVQFDDGPIPFHTSSSADSSSVFSPPPFHAAAATATSPSNIAAPVAVAAVGTKKPLAEFVDPLTAALEGQDEGDLSRALPAATGGTESVSKAASTQGSSPNISILSSHNSMPTEYPTHMASPPLPQRPLSIGGTSFTAFQAFSSTLQPPTTSGTPASTSSISGSDTPVALGGEGGISNASLDSISGILPPQQQQDQQDLSSTVGLGLDQEHPHAGGTTGSETPPPVVGQQPQQWTKRLSIGVSTNPSGISFQDHSDMVRQELKSPEQDLSFRQQQQQGQHHQQQQYPLHRTPGDSPSSDAGSNRQDVASRNNTQLHIRPVEHGRDHPIGIRSPVFAIPQSPMRQEGFPVLNSHSMFHEINMSDAMNNLMTRHIPVEQRVLRDWGALTEAEQRQASRREILHELTINNSWQAMTRYTRSQILMTPAEQVPELINLWYARLLALVKIGQYEMAQAELDQLGDLRGPQYRYENYPPGMFASSIGDFQTQEQQRNEALRRGCMVPFEMFVLKARLQGYLGDVYEAIDQLYELIMHCKKFGAICRVSEDNVGVRQWHDLTGQLHLMVLNYLVELQDYPAATKHGRELAKAYPQDINFHSGLGRLYLQLGDMERAEKVFKDVEGMVQKQDEQKQTHYKLQLNMNRALLAITQGQWMAAKSAFEDVLVQEPENLAATNNLAVCELYAGQLNEAIPRLERLMFAYPTSAGTSEPLVFNMATLYELRTEGSLRKKQQMMVEVSKWAGDQFNVGMFKI